MEAGLDVEGGGMGREEGLRTVRTALGGESETRFWAKKREAKWPVLRLLDPVRQVPRSLDS